MNLLSYSSVGQKSEISFAWLKSRCWQVCIPSRSSRGGSVCLFQPLEASGFLGSWPLPPASKHFPPTSDSVFIPSLSDSSPPAIVLQGPLWLHQAHLDNPDNLHISRCLTESPLQSPFYHVRSNVHRFQWYGHRYLWGHDSACFNLLDCGLMSLFVSISTK